MKYIALLLLLSMSVQAQDVTYLKQGEVAGYDGFLFSVPKEKELRLLDAQLTNCVTRSDLLMRSYDLQTNIIALSDKRLSNYQEQIDNLNKQAVTAKSDTFWMSALYFLSGAVITGLVAFGLAKGYGR